MAQTYTNKNSNSGAEWKHTTSDSSFSIQNTHWRETCVSERSSSSLVQRPLLARPACPQPWPSPGPPQAPPATSCLSPHSSNKGHGLASLVFHSSTGELLMSYEDPALVHCFSGCPLTSSGLMPKLSRRLGCSFTLEFFMICTFLPYKLVSCPQVRALWAPNYFPQVFIHMLRRFWPAYRGHLFYCKNQ